MWYGSTTLAYALSVGLRYLRSKKRKTINAITVIAVLGVALGVGSLLAVMAITGGFQDAFQNKILGVNAHALVLKYGVDFTEYREVIEHAEELPEVAGAAPFVIHEMMLAKGDRLSGVLVKGVLPDAAAEVLDLPGQIVAGTMDGLGLPGRTAPRKEPRARDPFLGDEDLDAYLQERFATPGEQADAADEKAETPTPEAPSEPAPAPVPGKVHVPTPEEMEAALNGDGGGIELPDDMAEAEALKDPRLQTKKSAEALPGVVVGATLAETLGLKLGDEVRIISPLAGLDTSMWQPDGGAPRSLDFKVIGIFQAGFQEYDSRLVYVHLYEGQRFFDHGDAVTGVEIRLHDIYTAPGVSRKLEADLGGGPYHTMDWQELNHNLFTALEMQKLMLSLVIATIIFVAAFNVIATLIMIVIEKKREIAILKAMGAKDRAILGIFLVQGVVIGLIGTAIGLVLGSLVTGYLSIYSFPLDPKVYLIDHLPVRVSPLEFAYTIGIAFLICTAATLVPSYWAARLLPADGVRYE